MREIGFLYNIEKQMDFVSYAITIELFLYAKAKVLENPGLAQRTDKLPLLHAMHSGALQDLPKRFFNPSWHSLLKTVLDQGADPDLEYKGKSAWR